MKKLTYQYIQKEVEKDGVILISSKYINSLQKLHFKCVDKKHEFTATWKSYSRFRSCSVCNHEKGTGKRRLKSEEVLNRINNAGFQYISGDYKNATSSLVLKCKNDHLLETNLLTIYGGYGCRICGVEKRASKRRYTNAEIAKLINKSKAIYIKGDYKNGQSELTLQCKNCSLIYSGKWDNIRKSIIRGNNCCPACSKTNKKELKFIIEQINKTGEKYISGTYENCHSKLTVKCSKKGCLYQISWNDFNSKRRCSSCAGKGFDGNKSASLYYLKVETDIGIFYKIGITNQAIIARTKCIPYKTTLLWYKPYLFGFMAFEEERKILDKYKRYRYTGDNLEKFGGYTELFNKDVLGKDG